MLPYVDNNKINNTNFFNLLTPTWPPNPKRNISHH